MISRARYMFLAALFGLALVSGAGAETIPAAEKRILTVVSILPLAEFVEQVGGERVQVEVMLPPGASPSMYEPLPRQLKAVAEADLYTQVGEAFVFDRVWLPRLLDLNANMDICHASVGITGRMMATGDGTPHRAAAGTGDHDHSHGQDPHVWLSVRNAQLMVQNIRDCLSRVDPAHQAYYQANAGVYLERLRGLDENIRRTLSPLTQRSFMVFHPAWGYFADDYGLTQLAVEVEGKEPSPQQLRGLITQAQALGIRTVLVSPQFSQQSARVIAKQIRGEVAFLDPLAKDYENNLQNVADTLVQTGGARAVTGP